MIASSGSMWLSEQPKDPESNARTVQTSSLVSAESGPAGCTGPPPGRDTRVCGKKEQSGLPLRWLKAKIVAQGFHVSAGDCPAGADGGLILDQLGLSAYVLMRLTPTYRWDCR